LGFMFLYEGQHLVTEEEPDAASLLQLRELKGQYRQRYQVHCDIKAEVDYCQQLVDQCRVKLFSGQFSTYLTSYSRLTQLRAFMESCVPFVCEKKFRK